jgi:pimeloyl-ACP methyl ester carboxylesterase
MTAHDIFGHEGPFRHRKDKVNGISLHSVVGGTGPAVLFLHGWPQTWWEWRRVMPALLERSTVIAVDLRGFGDSERPAPERGYDAATMCADLVGLLDTLDISSVNMVGHDLGGLVAYALARLHPNGSTGLRFSTRLCRFSGSTFLPGRRSSSVFGINVFIGCRFSPRR